MNCKKIIALILSLAVMATGLSAPKPNNPLAGLGLAGYSIQSIRPASLRSLSGTVTVKVNNTGSERSFRNVSAILYHDGKKVAQGFCSDLVFVKGVSSVTVTGEVRLVEGVTLRTALASAVAFVPSAYTADVICSIVDAEGRAESFVRRGIPVGAYIK